ncbi:uncharacterized protein LOC143288873 isoform X2 [Babylonia areolata]
MMFFPPPPHPHPHPHPPPTLPLPLMGLDLRLPLRPPPPLFLGAPLHNNSFHSAPSSEKGTATICHAATSENVVASTGKGALKHTPSEKGTPYYHVVASSEKGIRYHQTPSSEKKMSFHVVDPGGKGTSSSSSFCPASEKGPTPVHHHHHHHHLSVSVSEKADSFPVPAVTDKTGPSLLRRSAADDLSLYSSTSSPDNTTTPSFLHTSTCSKLSGNLAPFPTLPHPLSLLQQLRRSHHGLMMSERRVAASERLVASDVILPKTSPTVLPMTSPPPVPVPVPVPAPATALQSFLSRCAASAALHREEDAALGAATVAGPTSGFPPSLMMMMMTTTSEASASATSPYGRKVFPCPQCRYTTDRRNNLKRHMLTMHQLSAKLLECCGVLFHTKAALREHALVFHYHGYSCFYCGRRFCRKALLKRHLAVHSGQKEFLCTVCDYATSHKSNLERHRRVHVRQDMEEDDDNKDDVTARVGSGGGLRDHPHHRQNHDDHHHHHHYQQQQDRVSSSLCDDVKSTVSESNSHVDCVSFDDMSVSSEDEDEEINVHSD